MGSRGISDHLPIYLEIYGEPRKPKGPFKFNSSWIKNPTYVCMIMDFWRAHPPAAGGNIAEGFSHNIIEMKRLSNLWAHNKRIQDDETLRGAETKIVDFENNLGGVYRSNEHKDKLTSLYATRGNILKECEEACDLRSSVI